MPREEKKESKENLAGVRSRSISRIPPSLLRRMMLSLLCIVRVYGRGSRKAGGFAFREHIVHGEHVQSVTLRDAEQFASVRHDASSSRVTFLFVARRCNGKYSSDSTIEETIASSVSRNYRKAEIACMYPYWKNVIL